MKVKALVAARAGSVRVESKNTRPFASTTLLDNKLSQLHRIRRLDGVIVSSEDDDILCLAERYGCETMRRSTEFASSQAIMSDVYEYMATRCEADVIVYANCTSPLVRDCTVRSLIEEFMDSRRSFDSLNTGTLVKEFLVEDGKALNYDPLSQPRSQDLPDIVALNFAVNILERGTMIEKRNVIGSSPRIRILDEVEGIDIDTPVDFSVAEFLFQERGGDEYLRSE